MKEFWSAVVIIKEYGSGYCDDEGIIHGPGYCGEEGIAVCLL